MFLTLVDETGQQVYEAFYGGAAGGGKSEALLMAAAQYIEVPGYAALILRRSFPDLAQPGALIDRSKQWWTGKARWNENEKAWYFPTGSIVKFGHLEHDKDKYKYMGSEFQFIGFDEATQFDFRQYQFLQNRCRRTQDLAKFVPLRIRAASNPGNIGHEWVKQHFLVEGPDEGRIFVPATLDDNPSLDQISYRDTLDRLDPITRAQLLDGDWDVSAGGASFRRHWFGNPLDTTPADISFERIVRAWDTAATAPTQDRDADYTVGIKMGRGADGLFYILDINRFQGTPQMVELEILTTAHQDGQDVEIYMEQEPGASGKHMIEHYQFRVLNGFYFQGIRSTGSKPARTVPFSSAAEAKRVRIIRGTWISKFFDELEGFPYGAHDDQVDAASLAFNQLTLGGELRPANDQLRQYFQYW